MRLPKKYRRYFMLYDIENHVRPVKSKTVEEQEALSSLLKNSDPRTLDKMIRTLDAAIDNEVKESNKRLRLTWTKTGALVGFNSKESCAEVNHFWKAAEKVMGDGRPLVFAVGLFVKWRISQRDETWLTNKKETGHYDPIDGNEIKVAQYWINEDFVYTEPTKNVVGKARKALINAHNDYIESTPMLEAMRRAVAKTECKHAR